MFSARTMIGVLSGGSIAACMQAICKNADMEYNILGRIGAGIVGTCCGFIIADWCVDRMGLESEKKVKEDEAD